MENNRHVITGSDIVIVLFLLAMYSIGTISAIKVSWIYTIISLVGASVILIGIVIIRKRYTMSYIANAWLIITLVAIMGTIRTDSWILIIFYILSFIILAFISKVNFDAMFSSLKLLKIFGVIFAIGTYWQYLFPEQYYSYLYPMFGFSYQTSIRRQFTFHKMCTGFTSQTAINAEFILLGIISIALCLKFIKKPGKKIINFVELLLLTGALILTGKRSPIVCILTTWILIDMLTVKRSKKVNRLLQIALILGIGVLILCLISPFIAESGNSVFRIIESFSNDSGDISNGRFMLYSSAISYFFENPVFGIGWGKFAILEDITGVHNIYLQLLCETGIIGFVIVCGLLIYMLVKSIQIYKRCLTRNIEEVNILLRLSLFIQLYILIYGFFGNPIYDQSYLLMYVFGLSIVSYLAGRVPYSYLKTEELL